MAKEEDETALPAKLKDFQIGMTRIDAAEIAAEIEYTQKQEALKEGLPIIKLLDHALAPYEKPWGHYFDACAAGRLLLLSPWEYQTQKVTLTRDMCNLLNTMAAKLC